MAAPGDEFDPRHPVVQPAPADVSGSGSPARVFMETLPRCLVLDQPEALPALQQALASALEAGGQPFEVIAGTPVARYGARVTILPRAGREAELAAAFGLAAHPWGLPAWIGLRVRRGQDLGIKAYHRMHSLDERFTLPDGLPDGLHPVAAALDGESRELYLRLRPALPWPTFVAACRAAFGPTAAPPRWNPAPRAVELGFALSLRWEGVHLAALSLFAQDHSLPGDATIREAWVAELDGTDRAAYEAALAAVRALGPAPPGGWHALLAWSFASESGWHRAASLRVPGQLVVSRPAP